MSSVVYGSPTEVALATTEKLSYLFDFSSYLQPGQILINPRVTVSENQQDQDIVLPDNPAISNDGLKVSLRIDGSVLKGGRTYRVVVTADILGSVPVISWSLAVDLHCDF